MLGYSTRRVNGIPEIVGDRRLKNIDYDDHEQGVPSVCRGSRPIPAQDERRSQAGLA